jgi:hypothetical protein
LNEAAVRAALSGLGFVLQREMGTYIITDQRAAMGLSSAAQPVICKSLSDVMDLFHLS